jgi:hypothetical protein
LEGIRIQLHLEFCGVVHPLPWEVSVPTATSAGGFWVGTPEAGAIKPRANTSAICFKLSTPKHQFRDVSGRHEVDRLEFNSYAAESASVVDVRWLTAYLSEIRLGA